MSIGHRFFIFNYGNGSSTETISFDNRLAGFGIKVISDFFNEHGSLCRIKQASCNSCKVQATLDKKV